jgi:hypothetical protein
VTPLINGGLGEGFRVPVIVGRASGYGPEYGNRPCTNPRTDQAKLWGLEDSGRPMKAAWRPRTAARWRRRTERIVCERAIDVIPWPRAGSSGVCTTFVISLHRDVSVPTRRSEFPAIVEAVLLRPSGGRTPASTTSFSTMQMTARSARPAASRPINCALADCPLQLLPPAADTSQLP